MDTIAPTTRRCSRRCALLVSCVAFVDRHQANGSPLKKLSALRPEEAQEFLAFKARSEKSQGVTRLGCCCSILSHQFLALKNTVHQVVHAQDGTGVDEVLIGEQCQSTILLTSTGLRSLLKLRPQSIEFTHLMPKRSDLPNRSSCSW